MFRRFRNTQCNSLMGDSIRKVAAFSKSPRATGHPARCRRCNVMAWSGFGLTLGLWGIVLMATKDMPTTGVDADKRVVDRALMKAQVKQGQADQAWWLQGSADSPQQRPTVQTAEPRAQPKSTQSPAAPASAATHAVATPRYGLDTTFFLTPIQTPPPTVSAALPTATPGAAPGQPLPLTKACVAAAKAVPSRSKFTLTHVINPFPTTDVHFNFTVRSIIAAVQYARARNITVQVLGITFDNELVELPEEVGSHLCRCLLGNWHVAGVHCATKKTRHSPAVFFGVCPVYSVDPFSVCPPIN